MWTSNILHFFWCRYPLLSYDRHGATSTCLEVSATICMQEYVYHLLDVVIQVEAKEWIYMFSFMSFSFCSALLRFQQPLPQLYDSRPLGPHTPKTCRVTCWEGVTAQLIVRPVFCSLNPIQLLARITNKHSWGYASKQVAKLAATACKKTSFFLKNCHLFWLSLTIYI